LGPFVSDEENKVLIQLLIRTLKQKLVFFQVGFYHLSKPGEEERVVRYEADGQLGFKANFTYNNPAGSAYLFQNR
jgi:hypothetical protein